MISMQMPGKSPRAVNKPRAKDAWREWDSSEASATKYEYRKLLTVLIHSLSFNTGERRLSFAFIAPSPVPQNI
jgi:hypothetical protein